MAERHIWFVKVYGKRKYWVEESNHGEPSKPRLTNELEELEEQGYKIWKLIDRPEEVVVYAKKKVTNEVKRWCIDVWINREKKTVGLFETQKEAEKYKSDMICDYCELRSCWVEPKDMPGVPPDRFEQLDSGHPEYVEEKRWYITPEEYEARKREKHPGLPNWYGMVVP